MDRSRARARDGSGGGSPSRDGEGLKTRRDGAWDEDGGRLFEDAMRDVEPVAGPRPVLRRPAASRRSAVRPEDLPRPPRFTVERDGVRVRGLAEGRRPRLLVRLRGGGFPVERRIDLHGFTAAEARRAVEAELLAARAAGQRCALVIHGRGRGSAGAPVLRESLPGWLTEFPLAHHVVAFTTAPDPLGGSGATLVLLRVRKGPSSERS